MVSFKVQHRSSSSSFRAIAALLIALTFRLCCFDVVTVEAYALRHRSSGSGDDQRLLLATTATTLADAHNLIASTASAAAETSAAPLTVNLDGSPKVCAFRLHRLADAPFDNHITVLMPVRGPTFVRRQAYMLNKLEARFRHAGYTHVQFVIVYAVELEEEEERPAVEVASNKMNSTATTSEAVVADEVSRAIIEDHFERVDSVFNVTVLRRTVSGFGGIVSVTAGANGEPINIEKLFRPSAAYVFDACGRFAYLIYSPWSSIQRPYIKASILSTMYDAPCGQCEDHPTTYPVQSTTPLANLIATSPTSSVLDSSSSTSEMGTSTERAVKEVTEPAEEHISSSSIVGASSPTTLTELSSTEPSSSSPSVTNNNPNPKRNAPLQLSVQPDTAFEMPIRVLAPIVHAHRDWTETIAAPNASLVVLSDSGANNIGVVHSAFANASQYYLKYNYIVMRSDDPNYHAHLPGDRPERLALIPRTTIASAANNRELSSAENRSEDFFISDAVATNELHFVTDYGKRFVAQTSGSVTAASATETVASQNGGDTSSTISASQFPADFVHLEEIPRHSKHRSNTGRMVGVQNAAVDSDAEEATLTANGQEERAIDEHYSKIIQWIQFNL